MRMCGVGELLTGSRKVESWLNQLLKRGWKVASFYASPSPREEKQINNQLCITLLR
jgi:hypothetical protein